MTDQPASQTAEPTAIQPTGIQPWEGSSGYVNQGRHWSSALIWISCTLFGLAAVWAFTARLDQTVTVRGRLEPTGSVEDVESPSAGVVRRVFVREGQKVRRGTPLFDVEAKGLASRREALTQTLALLDLQSTSLQDLLNSGGDASRFNPLPPLPPVSDPALSLKLATARQQVQQFRSQLLQLQTKLQSRQETLRLQQGIANDMAPLYRSGGMARNQYLQQLNQIQETRSDVANLREEKARVIGQAAAQLNELNRESLSLRAELVGLKETISYRTVHAPADGTVFNLQLSPYKVVNSDQVALKLVPADRLQAKVDIGNNDIGFIAVGMPATVSVDSFPSGEFGYIRGTVSSIGSDALPPDQTTPAWRFPAVIRLQQQHVESGRKRLNLQSGMSVSANIKLRTRPVITLITDMFTRQLDGVKRFR